MTAVAFAGAAASCTVAADASKEPLPPLLVSAAADRTLRLWNLDTMRRLRVIYNRPAEISALAVNRSAHRPAGATLLLPLLAARALPAQACVF